MFFGLEKLFGKKDPKQTRETLLELLTADHLYILGTLDAGQRCKKPVAYKKSVYYKNGYDNFNKTFKGQLSKIKKNSSHMRKIMEVILKEEEKERKKREEWKVVHAAQPEQTHNESMATKEEEKKEEK